VAFSENLNFNKSKTSEEGDEPSTISNVNFLKKNKFSLILKQLHVFKMFLGIAMVFKNFLQFYFKQNLQITNVNSPILRVKWLKK
jgi:hypothetical protein